jgi:hypothetical protein
LLQIKSEGRYRLMKSIMEKIFIVISSFFVLFISTTNAVQVDRFTKFPVHFFINGQEKNLPNELAIYNINGSAYVPVRYVVNELGGDVFFNPDTANLSINQLKTSEKYASLSSIKKMDDFTLELHSEKNIYKQNELVNIWSSLSYQGIDKTLLKHGNPLLSFMIVDEQGVEVGGYSTLVGLTNEISMENQISNSLPLSTLLEYNFRKSGMTDYNLFLEKTKSGSYLPPGKYTITVYAKFSKDDERKLIESKTEIQVNVE